MEADPDVEQLARLIEAPCPGLNQVVFEDNNSDASFTHDRSTRVETRLVRTARSCYKTKLIPAVPLASSKTPVKLDPIKGLLLLVRSRSFDSPTFPGCDDFHHVFILKIGHLVFRSLSRFGGSVDLWVRKYGQIGQLKSQLNIPRKI